MRKEPGDEAKLKIRRTNYILCTYTHYATSDIDVG